MTADAAQLVGPKVPIGAVNVLIAWFEQAPDLPGYLQVLSGGDHEGAGRGRPGADVDVGSGGLVGRGINGDTEEAKALGGAPTDLRGVLPDPPVKRRTSTPPIAAVMDAMELRNLCT